MTFDISDTLAPNSDQLDAVDLLGGPQTFTIAGVRRGKDEQPVEISLAEFPRVWRPGKSMRRVLVAAWGPDASAYVGRRVTLYCDPNVKFGGEKVGGTRISHMTHLKGNKPLSVPLLISRGKSAMFTVQPLTEPAPTPSGPTAEQIAASTDVDELRGMENTKYNNGGINVEGIAWDPGNKRLLLGLRSPVVEGNALIMPLKLRDPKAGLSFDNLEVEGRKAIRLAIGGAGIRSIEYDEPRKAFFLITGAGPNSEKMDFKTWEWSGDAATPALRELSTFDRRLKPEGITRVSTGARDFVFIVFDTSGYAATE